MRMADWLSYQLSDFLLFSPQVYARLFVLHNADWWPLHVLTIALGLGAAVTLLMPSSRWMRLSLVAFGLLWFWVAWSFLIARYATINWAAVYVAPAFVVEGLLLLALGLRGSSTMTIGAPRFLRWVLVAVLMFAVLGYPVLAAAIGLSWSAAEVFGLAPDPTAVATLALLGGFAGRLRAVAMVVPLLWCLITGVTLLGLGTATWFVAPLMAGVCLLGIASRRL